jgi:hypothetical protein
MNNVGLFKLVDLLRPTILLHDIGATPVLFQRFGLDRFAAIPSYLLANR